MNPVVTTALTQLTQGGLQPGRDGGLQNARLRYFDPDRKRAGLPEDVAALITEMTDAKTVVTLVNVSPSAARTLVVQGGAFADALAAAADLRAWDAVRVGVLGKFPLPIEAVRFGLTATRTLIGAVASDAGCTGEIKLRLTKDGKPFATDSGNVLFDCSFSRIDNPEALDQALKRVPGVVENGLFLGIADAAIIAGPDGVAVIERDAAPKER
jgi:hypothetical protein